MNKLLLAFEFLTVIPVPKARRVEEEDLAGAMAWFPLVGLLLGAAAAAIYRLVALGSGSLVQDFLPVAFLLLVTGNLHGDGLMDAADGLFSGQAAGRSLEIMKDSRVGSHGVAAAILSFGAKIVFLQALAPATATAGLVVAPVLARWAQVYAATVYPYARPGGTGNFTKHVGRRELAMASAVLAAVLVSLLGLRGIVLTGITFLGIVLAGAFFRKKVGGITGDTLGALNELVEILALAGLWAINGRWR